MRIRHFLAIAMLAGAAVLAVPSLASADPAVEANEHLRHCVEKALDNSSNDQLENALEDCHKASNIVTPAVPEIIWGGIAFLIVAGALVKVGFPAVRKTLAAREEKIRGDLEGAEQARAQANQELADYRAQLAGAKDEANRIVEDARQSAEGVRRDLIARAETEAAELRARAGEDIRLATERAQTELQGRVKDLSIELAEKVVEHNLDAATQRALIDRYISQVGSN
jgi:F-type H+-transporting ATPase subunit b